MNDPSIALQSISLQDPLAKKMQLLQDQNNSLRHEREAFESNIRQYVQTISQLEDQLSIRQRQNQELYQVNRQNRSRIHKLEFDLQHVNDQYKYLYNQINVGEKRGQRDLIIKEMQLTNQLNQIQYNSYSKIIIQLKQNLSSKNQEIINLNSENTHLKQKILQSTYQYQQQIIRLREEITQLKAQQPQPTLTTQPIKYQDSTYQRMMNARLDSLRQQMQILEKENRKLSEELLECKSELSHFKSEAEWLKIEIENVKSERQISMDFTEVRNIVNENVTLKKMLQEQTYKLNTLIRNNPMLVTQASEIDLTATFNDIESKYQQKLQQLQAKQKQLSILKKQMSDISKLKQGREQQHLKFKTITTKTIDKLKNIVKNYVPCFNLYGYGDFGLDQEECKLVQDNGADIYKEYDRISNDIIQKNAEINKLQSKIKELQGKIKEQDGKLAQQKQRNSQLKEENQRLLVSLESVTQRYVQEQQDNQNRLAHQIQSPRFGDQQGDSPSKNNKKRHYFPELNREQSLTKLDSMCDLALSLQKDRQQMLACIRSKDAIIAQANAQLKVLRNECKPKVYHFQSTSNNFYQGSNGWHSQPVVDNNTSQLLQIQAEQYQKLKQQIGSMANLYQNEIHLLQQQHRSRYSELSLKYTKLLSDNNELHEKIRQLQKIQEQTLQRQSQKRSNKAQSIQEDNAEGINVQDNFARDDKNVISQATIQIINDLLKKYQKQFSRFSSLYQTELAKARELRKINFQELNRLSVEKQLHEKIERIQQILLQKEETIRMLEEEKRQKQTQLQTQRQHYEQNQAVSQQRMAQLESRLNHITSELQILQKRSIDTVNPTEGTSSKSISFILTALSAKNQQIISLKQALQQKDRYNEQLSQQINNLKAKIQDQHSELQEQEFRQFKKLVQDGELSYVLEKAADLLASRQQNSQ